MPNSATISVLPAAAALVLLGAPAALSAPAPPPPPGLGIRLAQVPTQLAADPRAQAFVIDHLQPGTTIRRRVEVSNGTTGTMSVNLYPTAANIRDGQFVVAPGHAQNLLTTWTSFSPSTLTLPPQGRAMADVTIAVPRDAPTGEYYEAALAELPPKAVAGGFTTGSRVGVRVYLDVGPGGGPPSDFKITTLTASRDTSGKPIVTAAISNTGGRALDMRGSLRLDKGPGGLSAGPFPARLGTTLAPRQTETVTVELDPALPNGPWHARMDASSGVLKKSVEATITFPDKGSGQPVAARPVTAPKKSSMVPLIAAGVGGLLLMGLLLLFFLKRRSRPKDERDA